MYATPSPMAQSAHVVGGTVNSAAAQPAPMPGGGFYREHPPAAAPAPGQPSTGVPSMVSTTTPGATAPPVGRYGAPGAPGAPRIPSVTAGMHNTMGGRVALPPVTQPQPVEALYGQVRVSDPLLIQPPSLFNVVPPHWTYQVQTTLKEGGCWLVRRRFKHVVALEDRMRMECPGVILPPRPDKHVGRAIEEASALQTAEFALQRSAELEVYLNSTVQHPFAGSSNSLKLFLALQDDMGTAWPEVSSHALTRFSALTQTGMMAVSEHSSLPWEPDALEDNAELLALASSEGLRMGAVTQAVPKLEGAVTVLREYGESAGAVGMELSKFSKEVEAADRDLGVPIEIWSAGLLRAGRRQKRLALELSAALHPFVIQYKLCRYEKLAFQDRRHALQKRSKERGRADFRAQQLMHQQRAASMQYNDPHNLSNVERDASMADQMAVGAVHTCDVIGQRLKEEVNRISYDRRTEWNKSMKVICSAMKEASTEQVSIWEATRESFLQAFPEYNNNKAAAASAAAVPPVTAAAASAPPS